MIKENLVQETPTGKVFIEKIEQYEFEYPSKKYTDIVPVKIKLEVCPIPESPKGIDDSLKRFLHKKVSDLFYKLK